MRSVVVVALVVSTIAASASAQIVETRPVSRLSGQDIEAAPVPEVALVVRPQLTEFEKRLLRQNAKVALSFEQLSVLVKPGDHLRLMHGAQQLVKGRIVSLSSSLVVLENNVRLDLQEGDVWWIEERRRDSLANGALIGAISGLAAVGMVGFAIECAQTQCGGSSNGPPVEWGKAAVALGSILIGGAGVGVAVDAMVRGWQLVYERPAPPSTTATLSPVFTGNQKGVRLTIGF